MYMLFLTNFLYFNSINNTMSCYIVPLIVYSLVGLQILCFKIKLEKKNTYDKTKGNQILPYLHVSAISIY